MNEIKVGDRLWNNEREFAIIVTEVTEHTVSYVDKTGKTRNVQRERIHFDGRERKKGYNYLPDVLPAPAQVLDETINTLRHQSSREVLDKTDNRLLSATILASTFGIR
jgi:hypothetical protein